MANAMLELDTRNPCMVILLASVPDLKYQYPQRASALVVDSGVAMQKRETHHNPSATKYFPCLLEQVYTQPLHNRAHVQWWRQRHFSMTVRILRLLGGGIGAMAVLRTSFTPRFVKAFTVVLESLKITMDGIFWRLTSFSASPSSS